MTAVASVVTGGGRGLGRNIAQALSKISNVILVGRTQRTLDEAVADIRSARHFGDAVAVVGDVALPTTAAKVIETAKARGWWLRNVVCGAGIGKTGATASFGADDYDAILRTNVDGVWHFTQACLPDMISRKQGTVLYLSRFAVNSDAELCSCVWRGVFGYHSFFVCVCPYFLLLLRV